ncbi:30S ribosomal protein S9 [Microgenomates group bacterium RIFCSPLOWO2_01_FULL_47_10]|nr:MAG: 30S ribosomal protein S9 [Microgenomates group bacterium RIFCSPLOWO2_01_FULL_47_10]
MPDEIKAKVIKAKSAKVDYTYAVGRRKTATARVRLFAKDGDLIVNGMPAGQYFPTKRSHLAYLEPFKGTSTMGKFSFSAKVEGSGKAGQVDAVIHGIARALAKFDASAYRSLLKKQGLLTRDPREKERRKVGKGGKARRTKQSPKR